MKQCRDVHNIAPRDVKSRICFEKSCQNSSEYFGVKKCGLARWNGGMFVTTLVNSFSVRPSLIHFKTDSDMAVTIWMFSRFTYEDAMMIRVLLTMQNQGFARENRSETRVSTLGSENMVLQGKIELTLSWPWLTRFISDHNSRILRPIMLWFDPFKCSYYFTYEDAMQTRT